MDGLKMTDKQFEIKDKKMTEEEKRGIAGRVVGMLSTKFKKEILEDIKEIIPDIFGQVKQKVKDELEPRINNIMKSFEDFLKEKNIEELLSSEAKRIMLNAVRERAENWARKSVKGVKFSFDEIYEDY